MPKQLNNGRITSALQRAFGFKGRYIPMLDEVIVPVYVIADPSPADVTRLCSGTIVQQAVTPTSDIPKVQIHNPIGSGVIANITTTIALGVSKEEFLVVFTDTPLTELVAGATFFRDRRIQGEPILQLRRQNDATGLGNATAVLQVDGTFSQTAAWVAETGDPRQPLTVLGPGQGIGLQFRVAPPTSVEEIRVNFRWLEIPITEVGPIGGLP